VLAHLDYEQYNCTCTFYKTCLLTY